ncbi:MAG: aldolase [Acidobacteriota bacterium]
MFREFNRVGKSLQKFGLISSHAGNMSVRKRDKVFITKHGAMLGDLKKIDIIEVSLDGFDEKASMELKVHQEIYKEVPVNAIIHSHPPYTIALSLKQDFIIPEDSEGKILLGKIPCIEVKSTVGSEEVAKIASKILKKYKVIIVKGHGSFAVGNNLEEALCFTSSLEFSSKIIYLLRD